MKGGDWTKVVGAFYTPTGQKGGYWGNSGGWLRYFIMIIILIGLMFLLLFFLD